MPGLQATDALVWLLALLAVAAAAVAGGSRDRARSAGATLLSSAAVAAMFVPLGAPASAALPFLVTGALYLRLRRATQARGHLEEASRRDADAASRPRELLRSLPFVALFGALLARPLLMASWPLATRAVAQGAVVPGTSGLFVPPLGPGTVLLVAALLLAAGLAAAVLRRSAAGTAAASAFAANAAMLAAVACSIFVGNDPALQMAGAAIFAAGGVAPLVYAVESASNRTSAAAAPAGSLFEGAAGAAAARAAEALAAGLAVALLVGSW